MNSTPTVAYNWPTFVFIFGRVLTWQALIGLSICIARKHIEHYSIRWCSGNNQSVGSSAPVVSRWLWTGNRTVLEVTSMVVTWWIVFFCVVLWDKTCILVDGKLQYYVNQDGPLEQLKLNIFQLMIFHLRTQVTKFRNIATKVLHLPSCCKGNFIISLSKLSNRIILRCILAETHKSQSSFTANAKSDIQRFSCVLVFSR